MVGAEKRPLTPRQQTDALLLRDTMAELRVCRKKLESIAMRHTYPVLREMAVWAGVNQDKLEEELAEL